MFKKILQEHKPILVYSDLCNYSKKFLQLLKNHQDLFDSFVKLNIDPDKYTKKRPQEFYIIQQELGIQIKKVPSLLVIEGNDLLFLCDADAFKWLEFNTKQRPSKKNIGYNKHEMNSFSDDYSKYGSTDINEASEQNYTFSKKNGEFLMTHDNLSPQSKPQSQPQQSKIANKPPPLDVNRQGSRPSQINFADPNFGLAGRIGQVNSNVRMSKSAEIEARMKQLELDRSLQDK